MKPIRRFQKGTLHRRYDGQPQAKIGNAEMSEFTHVGPVLEASFNSDGTLSRVETPAAIYVQVRS